MEAELRVNPEFKADWERIKAEFPIDKYRNRQGIIRRRFVQERNFRPADWEFSWQTETDRFRNVFDAFCHKWNLYGMEGRKTSNLKSEISVEGGVKTRETALIPTRSPRRGRPTGGSATSDQWEDKPLLLKLSVNLTAFGTLIEIPKYWSFDPKRDVNWGEVTKLHRMREVKRQGPKLSPSRAARHTEAAAARRLWREATRAGLKGDGRKEWVMERLGWDVRTDESRLRRLLKR